MDKKQIELKIIKVWGTVDEKGAFPYINIYDTEEDAKKEIRTVIDGLKIVDVVSGWFIEGTEDAIDTLSKDFYFTKEEALDDLQERIIPAHQSLGFEVNVKEPIDLSEVIQEPLSIDEIRKRKDENDWIKGIIAVPLDKIIETDYEGFLDILSEMLGDNLLQSIQYSIVGHQDEETILFAVEGSVEYLFERIEEYEEQGLEW